MTSTVARTAAIRACLGSTLVLGAWLFLAAMPALADGGPHIAAANSGASTLTSDSCAGCHRAHTAKGEYLINASSEEALCLTCHGASGTGATTDVESGVQYGIGTATVRGAAPAAGALRGGGFVDARIGSTSPSRISYPKAFFSAYVTWFSSKVPVLAAGAPITSAHLALGGSAVVAKNVAWGNGGLNTGAGPTVSLECTSCHNPHGNGQYRILNPVPNPTGTGFVAVTAPGALVTDAALPSGTGAAGTRNYTVLWGRTLDDVVAATYPGGGTGATSGDYWRRYLPWDGVPGWNGSAATPASGSFGDKPMYVPNGTNLTGFRTQITQWCSACHTRYDQVTGATVDTGDAIYRYRHDISQVECTQCHVAHGSNALMPGAYSGPMTYPDGSAATGYPVYNTAVPPAQIGTTYANSRLLKIDNRGTCQACHDPTGTIPFTNVTNP